MGKQFSDTKDNFPAILFCSVQFVSSSRPFPQKDWLASKCVPEKPHSLTRPDSSQLRQTNSQNTAVKTKHLCIVTVAKKNKQKELQLFRGRVQHMTSQRSGTKSQLFCSMAHIQLTHSSTLCCQTVDDDSGQSNRKTMAG